MAPSPRPVRRIRRGETSGAVVATAVGVGLIMLVVGYLLGRVGAGDPMPGPAPIEVANNTGQPAEASGELKAGLPPIRFDPPEIDFGYVEPGTTLRSKVRMYNVGDASIKIKAMRPSCKCTTVADLTGAVIPVGNYAPITAELDSTMAIGNRNASIRFLFDGYDQVVELKVRATVSNAVRAEPPAIDMHLGLTGNLTIESGDGKPFNILSVNGGPPVFADGFDPATDEPQAKYFVPWDLERYDQETCLDANGNRMPLYYIIETDHPSAPIVPVHVRHVPCSVPEMPQPGQGWLLSDLFAVLPTSEDGAPVEMTVQLKWRANVDPNDTVREVQSESPNFTARLIEVSSDLPTTARIEIIPTPGFRGVINGDLRVVAYQGHSRAIRVIGAVRSSDG